MSEMIKVKGLCKKFGELTVLKGIDFEVNRGETIAVIGPSGAGKSTMLRCLINLDIADGGEIIIDGASLTKDGVYPDERICKTICSKMGMVFQNFNLFTHISVMDNLIYAPTVVKKETKVRARKRAIETLKKVGLEGKENSMPLQLSGGEKQRVAIARALMMNPEVLLFDEPTSSLDPQLTGEVLAVMKNLAKERMTMVVVTHEMGFAREAADRILFMDENKILADDIPENIFDNPPSDRIKSFIDSIL